MIRTVLCPVDLTDVSRCLAELAAAVAGRLGARLVLHHNIEAAPPSPLGVGWMWSEDHERQSEGLAVEAAASLEAMLAGLHGVEAEAKITRGPLDEAVHEVAREVRADLLVIGKHGAEAPVHDSMTERIVLNAPCAVLALGDACRHEWLSPESWLAARVSLPVVVPCDFTRRARRAVAYALALSRRLPLRLHLLHVLEGQRGRATDAERKALDELRNVVPEPRRGRLCFHVAHGEPAPRILELLTETRARLVLMAAHGRGPLRRVLFGTTTLDMLHRCGVPIWYVPEHASPVSRLAEKLQRAVE